MSSGKIPSEFTISGSVADGSYVSPQMDSAYERIYLGSIRFFDSSGAQVTPGAGSVTFEASPDGVNYQSIQGGSFAAADSYISTRTIPSGQGPARRARITLSGITGAQSFVASVARF
jgi:hypothetical protein